MKKTVLITGCSSGIGADAAHGLREQGWRVFASCRLREGCDRLGDQGFSSPRIDYTDQVSIEHGLREVLEATGGRLDAVIHSGAHGMPGAIEDVPVEAMRRIFEANFFGWHHLTRLVIPVMREQGHGKIVMISSVLGLVPMALRGPYVATKYAVEELTDTLRVEMRDTPIDVITVEPGPVTSSMRVKSVPHFERWIDWKGSVRRTEYEAGLVKRLYERSGKDPFELLASAVTVKLIKALEARRPPTRICVTTPTYILAFARRILPTRAPDWLVTWGN